MTVGRPDIPAQDTCRIEMANETRAHSAVTGETPNNGHVVATRAQQVTRERKRKRSGPTVPLFALSGHVMSGTPTRKVGSWSPGNAEGMEHVN